MGLAFRSMLARAVAGARRLASGLAKDARGNTLVIVGIAMIPLTAMIGSGVDMARGYMAQARMQQACDAGALAGRRAMTSGTVDQTVKDEAQKFFKFNFKTGTNGVAGTAAYGAKGFTPVVSAASDNASTVVINATTTIPTTVMKMFGHTEMTLTVTCNAKQDYVNTDVVLVLDTTGSMACDTAGNNCNSGSSSKIVALRAAVLALYDALAAPQTKLEAAGLRLRYGIVPYSSGVNIGKQLREMSSSYVVSDNWDYQSREAVLDYYNTTNDNGTWTVTSSTNGTKSQHAYYSTSMSSSSCTALKPADVVSTGSTTTVSTAGTTDANGVVTNTTVEQRVVSYSPRYSVVWGINDTSGNNRDCRIDKANDTETQQRTTTETKTPVYKWVYKVINYPVDQYVAGNAVTTKTGNGYVNVSSTWAGCIEENQTVSTITSTTTSIPTGAKDLDVNIIPSDKESRWKPYWPEVEYYPAYGSTSAGKPQVACPSEARRLQAWTRTNLSNYLNTLIADGGTYHDNGMRWGSRLISSGGVFGPDNPTTYGGMPVSKTIVFMTDGIIDTGDTIYTTYGMERFDKRVTGGWTSDTDQTGRHDARFKMMCTATKGMGVSIWVVAFASTLTTSLSSCATNSNQALVATTAADLKAKFEKIGNEIAALRLTQ